MRNSTALECRGEVVSNCNWFISLPQLASLPLIYECVFWVLKMLWLWRGSVKMFLCPCPTRENSDVAIKQIQAETFLLSFFLCPRFGHRRIGIWTVSLWVEKCVRALFDGQRELFHHKLSISLFSLFHSKGPGELLFHLQSLEQSLDDWL